jgi:hypothetical protein
MQRTTKRQKIFDLRPESDATVLAPNFQSSGWIVHAHGEQFDFAPYAMLGSLAKLLRDDFSEWAPVQERKTAMDRFRYLRMFFDFAATGAIGIPLVLSRSAMSIYAAHIALRPVGKQISHYVVYQGLAHHVRRLHDDGKIPLFRIPRKFSRAWTESEPVPTLSELIAADAAVGSQSKVLLREVLEFAWSEIRESMRRTREANRSATNYTGPLTLERFDSLVAYIDERFDGIPTYYRDKAAMAQPDVLQYRYALRYHGNIRLVATHLGPDVRMLVPFAVVFAAANVNPQSILKLRIDDLKDTDRRGWKKLDWDKTRAGGEIEGLEFPIGGANASTVPRAFEALLEITQRFRRSVSETNEDFAFLAWLPNGRSKESLPPIRVPSHKMLLYAFRSFRDDFLAIHPGWIGADGKKPVFALENIRATAINVLHADLGYDTESTRVSTRHRRKSTTARYLRHREHAAAREGAIRDSQEQMVTWVKEQSINVILAKPDTVADTLKIEASEALLWIEDAKNAVGNGFQCRNPMKSPMPGQVRGRLCTYFIGCFACANNIIIAMPLNAARLILWRRHVEAARPRMAADNMTRWNLIYEPQVAALSAALDDFPADVLVKGRSLAEQLRVPFPTVQ